MKYIRHNISVINLLRKNKTFDTQLGTWIKYERDLKIFSTQTGNYIQHGFTDSRLLRKPIPLVIENADLQLPKPQPHPHLEIKNIRKHFFFNLFKYLEFF